MILRDFNHIEDCWDSVDECNSVEDLNEAFDLFPRRSGDWDYEIDEDGYVVVINTYFDKDADCYEDDARPTDIFVGTENEEGDF